MIKRLKIQVSPASASDGSVGADRLPATQPLPLQIEDNTDGTYSVSYEPKVSAEHTIHIQLDDQHIRSSPFKLSVQQSPDASLCSIISPWLTASRSGKKPECTCGDVLELEVDTSNAGDGALTARARCDQYPDEDVKVIVVNKKNKPSLVFIPNIPKEGTYHIDVFWDGKAIAQSPFTFTAVRPFVPADIKVC